MATAATRPTFTKSASHKVQHDAAALVVLAIVVVAVRMPWLGHPVATADEQLYSLIGNALAGGTLPYGELWDRKPFGLFALFGLAHAVAGPSPAAYQVLAAIFTLAGAWLTMLLARPLVDRATAAGAGVLYILLMGVYGSHSGQSEAFHVPMILLGALLLRDPHHPRALGRACAAMLIGGLAMQVKYTVLPQCLVLGGWFLWNRHKAGDSGPKLVMLAALSAALGILPTVLAGTGFAIAGHWDAFAHANFLSFFDRAPADAGRLHADLAVQFLPLALLASCGVYAALRLNPPRDLPYYRFILLLLGGATATAFLPGTVYAYYFAAAVPACVLAALPLLDRTAASRWVPLAVLIAALAWMQLQPSKWEEREADAAAFDRLAAAISPVVNAEDECLWIHDGPAALYRATGSCYPTRFIYPDHLNNLLERDALGVSQTGEVRRILSEGPPVVVTAASALTPQNEEVRRLVMDTIATNYEPIAREAVQDRDYTAWGLRTATD